MPLQRSPIVYDRRVTAPDRMAEWQSFRFREKALVALAGTYTRGYTMLQKPFEMQFPGSLQCSHYSESTIQCMFVWFCMCLYMSISACICFCLSASACICVYRLYLSVSIYNICLCRYVNFCLSVSVCLSVSLSVSVAQSRSVSVCLPVCRSFLAANPSVCLSASSVS